MTLRMVTHGAEPLSHRLVSMASRTHRKSWRFSRGSFASLPRLGSTAGIPITAPSLRVQGRSAGRLFGDRDLRLRRSPWVRIAETQQRNKGRNMTPSVRVRGFHGSAEASMFSHAGLQRLCGLIVLAAFSTTAAWADSLVLVASQTGQGANDSVRWSQLGADGTTLGSSSSATSGGGSTIMLTLGGPSSVVSVACTASPCSWTGAGFTAGDSLIWTSDTGNGGNGPLTLSFSRGMSGVGALIQADGPGQFTAQIQAFNGATSLGFFTVASNANGDAAYIGILDQTGSNITSVVFSLIACAGTCTDFAIDTVSLSTAPATLVSLISSLSPSALGQAVTFTATVKPASGSGIPAGTVTFNDGATALGTGTLNGGTATFVTSGLGAGVHSITAVYGGDANFGGGTSPVLMQDRK